VSLARWKKRLSADPVKVPQAYGWVENKKLLGLRERGNCCGNLRKGITANGSPGANDTASDRLTVHAIAPSCAVRRLTAMSAGC
jgi:hypothetical protein